MGSDLHNQFLDRLSSISHLSVRARSDDCGCLRLFSLSLTVQHGNEFEVEVLKLISDRVGEGSDNGIPDRIVVAPAGRDDRFRVRLKAMREHGGRGGDID
jgi:hypothetical protein